MVAEVPQHLFRDAAKEWHATQVDRWTELHANEVMKRFEDNIFPTLGNRPVGAIEPKEMLATLKEVEACGVVETTRHLS